MSRSRVADDFAAIRARVEELQRERARILGSDRDGREPLRRSRPAHEVQPEQPQNVRIIPVLERRPRN